MYHSRSRYDRRSQKDQRIRSTNANMVSNPALEKWQVVGKIMFAAGLLAFLLEHH
jgi:hypothetical protein